MSIHPLPERLEDMASRFETIHHNNNAQLLFEYGDAPEDKCGTVACHGGWAGALLNVKDRPFLPYFVIGADALAQFLNAKWQALEDLENWAHQYPELWGNKLGAHMFEAKGYKAFGFNKYGKCTLQDIANHYRAVAKRIRELDE